MRLTADSGNAFELLILRYEFPDITEDRWDSNWLVVSGKVTIGDKTWHFIEPCVTTFELADLADWLETLGDGAEDLADCSFTEPNLAFLYSRKPFPVLRVRFTRESAPPWLKGPEQRAVGVTVSFPLTDGVAQEVAAEIRNALIEYPIRGGAA
jgi:hypothetical protein